MPMMQDDERRGRERRSWTATIGRRTACAALVAAAAIVAVDARAANGDADLKQGLALVDKMDFAKAAETFRKAYAAGNADGGFYLGRMAELGLGAQANPAAAAVLYRSAADKGSAKALNRVGLMQFRGEAGVLQDFAAARETLCKAADLGENDARFNCAEMWADGKGGPKDPQKALQLYQNAAENGHIGAMNVLGLMYRDGLGVAKDAAKSQGYFERSAAKGNPVGLFEIGRLAESAYQTRKAAGQAAEASGELVKAHLDYNLATARSHPMAAEALQRVSALMSDDEVRKAQSLAKEWKAAP